MVFSKSGNGPYWDKWVRSLDKFAVHTLVFTPCPLFARKARRGCSFVLLHALWVVGALLSVPLPLNHVGISSHSTCNSRRKRCPREKLFGDVVATLLAYLKSYVTNKIKPQR